MPGPRRGAPTLGEGNIRPLQFLDGWGRVNRALNESHELGVYRAIGGRAAAARSGAVEAPVAPPGPGAAPRPPRTHPLRQRGRWRAYPGGEGPGGRGAGAPAREGWGGGAASRFTRGERARQSCARGRRGRRACVNAGRARRRRRRRRGSVHFTVEGRRSRLLGRMHRGRAVGHGQKKGGWGLYKRFAARQSRVGAAPLYRSRWAAPRCVCATGGGAAGG
jgi:hypothetical protein